MADVQQVIKDPNFLALPHGERAKVLRAIDPNFGGLPEPEQMRVVSSFGQAQSQPATTPQAQPEGPSAGQRFYGKFEQYSPIGMVKAIPDMARDMAEESRGRAGITGPGVVLTKKLIVDPAIQMGSKAKDAFKQGRYSEAAGYGLAAALPMVGPMAADIGETAGKGDIAGLAGAAVGTVASALAGKALANPRATAVEIGKGAKAVVKAPGKAISAGVNRVIDAARSAQSPETLMTQAVKPRANNMNWDQSLKTALPNLKLGEKLIGKSVETVDDAIAATQAAKKNIWEDYSSRLGRHKSATIDGNAIADSMVQSIDPRTAQLNPELAAKVAKQAETYRRPLTLEEAENFLHSANRDLHTYYSKNKVGQKVALGDPDMASTVAEAGALRSQIYGTLDKLDGPGAAFTKQKYGSLLNIEEELMRRRNVAARQQPESLSEQIGKWQSYGKVAKGLATGNAGAVVEGMAQGKMASALKEAGKADSLLRYAFKNYKGTIAPEFVPAEVVNKGMLSPPAIQNPRLALPGTGETTPFEAYATQVPGSRYKPKLLTAGPGGSMYQMPEAKPYYPPASFDEVRRVMGENPTRQPAPPSATLAPTGGSNVEIPTAQHIQTKSTGRARENAPVSGPRQSATPPATGRATAISVPGADRSGYKATYQVRELEDVQASHNAANFQPNEKYQLKNDRDYTRAENQSKILDWSSPAKFDPAYLITDNPDAINGPPVIDRNGNALGGNSRTMILDRVYSGNPQGAAAYKQMLAERAQYFGIDPHKVAGMKRPVLVREISDAEWNGPEAKQTAITDFNRGGTAELRPAEKAIADSRRVSVDTLDDIAARMDKMGSDATLAQALEGFSGTEIAERLIQDGVIAPQERAAYVSAGKLTDAGKARISKLMVGRFFRDATQLDTIQPALRGKIERIAAPLAKVETLPEWNLTPAVQEAVDLLEAMRATGFTNPQAYVKQSGLFGTQQWSEQGIALAEAIVKKNPTELTKAVRSYAADAAYSRRGPDLLGITATPEESFIRAFQK
jgi:hypothetical protein